MAGFNRGVLFCFVFIALLPVFAVDYFVDSESGDDTAHGTSANTAWKSLDAVNQADLQPGDVVRFKRGGQWRGQLKPKSGNENAPIMYTAYGSDSEKPRLLGSVPLNQPSDWIHEGGNLWSTRSDTVEQGNEILDFLRLAWHVHQAGGAAITLKTNPVIKEYTISCTSPGTQSNHVQLIVHGFKIERDKHYLFRFKAKSTNPFTIPSIRLSEPSAPWGGLGPTIRNPGEIGIGISIFRGSAVPTSTGRAALDDESVSVMELNSGPMPKIVWSKIAVFGKFTMLR